MSQTLESQSSPWGTIQHSEEIAEGIWIVSTASHGGIKLSKDRLKHVPDYMQRADSYAPMPWFEEDSAIALVGVVFEKEFRAWIAKDGGDADAVAKSMHDGCRNSYPDEYAKFTKTKVTLEQSRVLQRRKFEKDTLGKFIVRAAWGDWKEGVPECMVGVYARKFEMVDGERKCTDTKWFLIDADEYENRPAASGFVIDESRHKETECFNGTKKKQVG